ncbi:MAG TPA: glycosyltransferase family 4 protein [Pseudobdellovibrionaceae bacterium]|nr:glycosyltransferase family 4 protein [Pseudobdellovibrionaceae bacterium]
MKILMFGKHYPPSTGGIETATAIMARGLAQRGHEVFVEVAHERFAPTLSETEGGVRIHRCATWGRLFRQPLARWKTSVMPDAEHLILHTPNPMAAICARRWQGEMTIFLHAELQGWKGWIESRVLDSLIARPQFRSEPKANLSDSDSSRRVRIVVTSAWLAERIRSRFPQIPIEVIPLPVDPSWHFIGQHSTPRKKLRQLVSWGRLVDYKGFDLQIRAVAQVPELQLSIIGEGPLSAKLTKLAAKLAPGRIQIVGPKSMGEIQQIAQQSDLGLFTPRDERETYGIALLEAMSMGLPTLTTPSPTGFGHLQRHGSWVVESVSVEAINRGLLELRRDPRWLNGSARRALSFAAELTETNFINQWMKLLNAPDLRPKSKRPTAMFTRPRDSGLHPEA